VKLLRCNLPSNLTTRAAWCYRRVVRVCATMKRSDDLKTSHSMAARRTKNKWKAILMSTAAMR